VSRSLRVLVLTYETPAYPGGGGASRQHCLLEPLARHHTVRVVSTGGAPRFGRLPDRVDVELVDPGPEVPADGPWLRKNLGHYWRGRPWLHLLAEHHRRALAARLPSELRGFRPDVVVVQHGELAPLLDDLPAGTASVLELHNMLLSVQLQQLRAGRGRWLAVKSALELPVMARWERHDLRAATVAVAASEHDARVARRLARSARIAVVENCVDSAYFANPGRPAQPCRVLFSASFQYPPNQAAAVDLLREVLPAVRARTPDAELALAGQQMPDDLARLAAGTPGCRVVGEVADMREQLWAAAVALAPMRQGSGSPLKAIEALAAGVPVVGSRRVAAALRLREADGLLGADGPAELAAAITALLGDPARRARLGAAGVELARTRFDREVVAPGFEAAVVRAAAAAGSG
jgi:polysaccharide biosynthesis protein PslH